MLQMVPTKDSASPQIFDLKTFLIVIVLGLLVSSMTAAQPMYQHLRLIAPAAPGGGWDQTARVMQQVLQRAGIVHSSSVENIPGAAGTIGLARFVGSERGNGDVTMLSGLIMLAAVVTHRSAVTLDEVTPIARLIGEYEVIVVPSGSPFRSLHDLLRLFKENPESISWGGGSAGGTDQILVGLVANAIGVPPRRVNYIAFSGGGESMSAILGGQVSAGVNGLAEFAPQIEAGTVRVLAISSAERLPNFDVPTLREQGVDVVLENWRSLVAPPGISEPDRQRLESAIATMVRSQPWQEALARYRWNDRYLSGEAFATFVRDEKVRVESILRDLGTGGSAEASFGSVGTYPMLVLAGLVVSAMAFAIGVVRSTTSAEPPGAGFRALALIAVGIVVDILLIDRLGFVLASAALFWLTARAFDRGHAIRDAVFAVAVSVAAYVVFAHLLQLSLPAGLLAGWI
jgi:putative tricarboxylic transport membrane protein